MRVIEQKNGASFDQTTNNDNKKARSMSGTSQ